MEATQSLRTHQRATHLLVKCSLRKLTGSRRRCCCNSSPHNCPTVPRNDSHNRHQHLNPGTHPFLIPSSQFQSRRLKANNISYRSHTLLLPSLTSHRQP